MTTSTLRQPARLFLIALAALAYALLSLVLLRGVAPALVSSTDTFLVLLGCTIPGVWLIATACLGLHITNKCRKPAAATKE